MSRHCKRGVLAVLALLLVSGISVAGPQPLTILALGTSLTQGYGLPAGAELTALLEARLRARGVDAKLINAGVSGDTSAGGLARLDWSLGDHPDVAIVELGGNDALRGLAPEQTEDNLSEVLSALKAKHIPVLLLGMMAPRNFGPEYAQKFDAIYPRLATKYDVLFYPFVLAGVAMNPKLNQADGIHPNAGGEKIIADRIFPDVLKLVRQVKKRGQ